MITTQLIKKIKTNTSTFFLKPSKKAIKEIESNEHVVSFLSNLESKGELKSLNQISHHLFAGNISSEIKEEHFKLEKYRELGHELFNACKTAKIDTLQLVAESTKSEYALALIEGFLLSSYEFLKYFTDADSKKHSFTKLLIASDIKKKELDELTAIVEAVFFARDLVNEPVNYMTAEQLSKETEKLQRLGVKVEVFNKKKIESLKMGGLLAVNKGATNPPTFNVMEWKPKNAVNSQPYVLVGKGVVYDTGGANIKVEDYMNGMKADMGGGATVFGSMHAIAANQLPVHVIGLVPATENRINGHEYVPGDVIKMHNGKTVEVLNTDAEGRMILADALSYAQKFNPELVLDFATLTGAAYRAIGPEATVYMGTADDKIKKQLEKSGEAVFERIWEFPFWEEFGEQIKSDIADITNLGGPTGGAITAGKFLEHFTDYPWLHLDIAGPAYLSKASKYRAKGATGNGVRLVYNYLKNLKA